MKLPVLTFIFTILLLSSCQDKGRIVTPKPGPAHLDIPKQEWYLGRVPIGSGVKQIDVLMINDGSEDLTISHVENLCHCTRAEYNDRPIRPGHGARLSVYLNTDELTSGDFSRTVIVHSNGGDVAIDFEGTLQ